MKTEIISIHDPRLNTRCACEDGFCAAPHRPDNNVFCTNRRGYISIYCPECRQSREEIVAEIEQAAHA